MSDTTAKLLVSPSPHVHIHDSIERNMYDVIIALIPALIASVISAVSSCLSLSPSR